MASGNFYSVTLTDEQVRHAMDQAARDYVATLDPHMLPKLIILLHQGMPNVHPQLAVLLAHYAREALGQWCGDVGHWSGAAVRGPDGRMHPVMGMG